MQDLFDVSYVLGELVDTVVSDLGPGGGEWVTTYIWCSTDVRPD